MYDKAVKTQAHNNSQDQSESQKSELDTEIENLSFTITDLFHNIGLLETRLNRVSRQDSVEDCCMGAEKDVELVPVASEVRTLRWQVRTASARILNIIDRLGV